MSYAQQDWSRHYRTPRQLRLTADEEYRNNPRFKQDRLTGVVSAGLTAAILVLAAFGFIHLVGMFGGVAG